jgi:hypothetical protein
MASKERQIIRWNNIQQPDINLLKCYICDYENTVNNYNKLEANDIFNAGKLIRYKCPNCDVIFGDLRFLNMPLDEIKNDYEDLYSYYKEGDTTKYILEVLENMFFINDMQLKYLDYACGKWNYVVPTLKNKGYDIIGYDKYVSNNSYIVNDIGNSTFDVIFNCNYIEHLINPIEDIRDMISHLNNGGYIVFITQCFEYTIEFTHYHTFFFNDKSLKIIAEKLGLTLIYSNKFYFSDGEWTIAKVFKKNE